MSGERLTNQRFGHLVLVRPIEDTPNRGGAWECLCDCGVTVVRRLASVQNGTYTSCGCVRRGTGRYSANERPYASTWQGMIARCHDENNAAFANYGGRGIRVCEEWRASLAAFIRDLGPPPSPKHTIDRIDNDGNYEPGNCRWATRRDQTQNRRNSIRVKFNGTVMPLADAAQLVGLSYEQARYQVATGRLFEALPRTVSPRKASRAK